MNFQVTVLKVLVSYPDGFAVMEDIKRDMAILATSGRDWAERTKRLAARVPGLDIFSQGLIERLNGGWRITNKGRAILEIMEARPAPAQQATELPDVRAVEELTPAGRRHRCLRSRQFGASGNETDVNARLSGEDKRLRRNKPS
ncbi:hypothetical protein ABIA09_000175 [Bradyrhizobium yuanmingense]